MPWPRVPIGTVTKLQTGSVNPQAFPGETFAHYSLPSFDALAEPALDAGETIKSNKTLIKAPVVLFSKLNPRISRVWCVSTQRSERMVCSTEFVPLQPDGKRLNLYYLGWVLRSPAIVGQLKGQSQAATKSRERVTPSDVLAINIPLPPLVEQQRIVDILDRAAAIQRLRRAAEEKAREIIPALFVDMFGDPATNPKGWPMRKLEDVATVDRGRSRHRPRDDKALYNGAYPFIQTSEVANSGGLITHYTTTYSEFGLAQSKLWPPGTLCVTIAANIAKTGILQFAACFPDSVVAVIPGSSTNNEFLQAWLSFLQPTLEAQAPQLAQKNINLEILRALSVPMPPKSLQDRFADMCQRVRAMQALKRDGASVAISANQSLTSAMFSAVY